MDSIPNMFPAIFAWLSVLSLFLGAAANGVDMSNCTSLCDFHRHSQTENAINKSCTRTVTIQPAWADVKNGSFQIQRKQSLWLSSRVTLSGGQCPHINNFIWRWTVYSEENNQTIVMSSHDNGPYMLLKGYDLWYGHYTINTTLLSDNYEVTQTSGPLSQIRFTVYPTPLVVRIEGGFFRTIPQDTILEFDASGSYDPDELITSSDIKFYWYCLSSRIVASEPCFNFSEALKYTGPKLILGEYKNKFDTNVTVRVVAIGEGNEVMKEGEATQIVEIRRGVAPLVHFKCLYNCGDPNVSTAEKLVLQMSCIGCRKAGEVVWGWEIIHSAIVLYNNGSTGSIRPGNLAGGTSYELCAYGKFPHHPEHLSYMSRVCMRLSTSEVKSTGSCVISPEKGVSLLTPFKVTCYGTEPGSLIEVYQLFKGRDGIKAKMLRYQYDPTIDNLFLFADNNEMYLETVMVNITDADYTRVSTFELLVTVMPFTGHMCESDFAQCVRKLVLHDVKNKNVSFLEELASRGDQQGALHIGRGLIRMMVKIAGKQNSVLLEKVQLELLKLSLKLNLESIAAVKQMTSVIEDVLRATWPKMPSEEVVSLALDVGLKTSIVIAELASEDKRPIYNCIIEMTQLLMEALGGVCEKGARSQMANNETESAILFSNDTFISDASTYDEIAAESLPVDRSHSGSRVIEYILGEITDTLAESVAVHKFPGETKTSIYSTCMHLTLVRGLYGELTREMKMSPQRGFGWHENVRKGFVRFGGSKTLHNVLVTVHLVEYLMRPQSLTRLDDVTTRVMELRMKRDDAETYMTNLGPVDYYLYTQDNIILQWSGPLPLRAKLPQDYTPEDISSQKGSLSPDVRAPFEVAVLARAEDAITALEVKISSKSIPNLDAFSLHEVKPAPSNVSHPVLTPFDPVQYVMYVPEDILKEKATYYVGVLPFRNVSFRSFYHFETTKYSLSMQSAACYDMGSVDFYKQTGNTNCRVIKGRFTSLWSVACRCTPGSTRVGASLRAIKLHEDKPAVQLFLLISSNPSAMAFLGGIMVSYLITILLAWILDRKLQHKCGVTILRDSDPAHSKQYIAVVYTGGGWKAGTSARIAVRFNGLSSSSDIHVLTNSSKRHFARGGEDRFLFSTAKSLGSVTSVDVWTDLSGPSPEWFLHKIVLVDLTQEDTWDFVANKWFGKPKDDDEDVLLTSLKIQQQKERDKFRSLLIWKIMKGFHNDHLWLSILLRWPGSCFKCVHRVTALLVLVLFASFINLVLRGLPAENTGRLFIMPSQHPATLLESDLCSAFLSTCILIGVQMFFIQLLRKLWQCDKWETEVDIDEKWTLLSSTKPIPQQSSQETLQNVDMVSEEKMDETVVEFVSVVIAEGNRKTGFDLKLERKVTKETLTTKSERTVVSKETLAVPVEHHKIPDEDEDGVEKEICEDEDEGSPEEMRERKANQDSQSALREWINGFTWVTLAAITLTLLGVNMVYGLRMTVDRTNVWVLSTVISLGFSAFIFEPLVVVAIAAIGASRGQEKLIPPVGWRPDSLARRDKLIRRDGTHEEYRRYLVRLRSEAPLYDEVVSQSEKKRPRHIERHDHVMLMLVGKIFSFVAFVVFLWALILEVREELSYYSTTTANQLTVLNSFTSQKHLESAKVFDTDSFYNYLRFNLIPALQPDNLVNLPKIEAGAKLPWTASGSTFTVGAIRMRQLRSARVKCPVEFMTNMSYTRRDQELAEGNCIPVFSPALEETISFGRGWSLFMAGSIGDEDVWTYKDASVVPALSANGKILAYPAGGYVATLGATRNESMRIIDFLMTNNWVDRSTRAIIIELSTLSPFVNVLSIVQLVFEFPPIGGAVVSSYVDSFRPVHYLGYTNPGILFCYGSITVFCIVLAAIEVHKFLGLGRFYFQSGWNIVNLVIVILSCVYLACIFTSFGIDSKTLMSTTELDGSTADDQYQQRLVYFDPSGVVLSNRLGTFVLVILGTVSMAKLWKMLSFNRHMHGFVLTLRYCMAPLGSFLVTFLLVYMAFASFAHVLFGDMDQDMRTMGSTLGCMFFSTIGSVKFQLQNNRGSDFTRIGRMIFFTLFVFLVFVYMVSVFVSIILRSFKKGSERKGRMRNRYEILNFIITKVYSALGKDYPEGYRQCLDAVRESHLAELVQSADRMEKMADVARKAVRYMARMSMRDKRSLCRRNSRRV